jgi:hypothetical protein
MAQQATDDIEELRCTGDADTATAAGKRLQEVGACVGTD